MCPKWAHGAISWLDLSPCRRDMEQTYDLLLGFDNPLCDEGVKRLRGTLLLITANGSHILLTENRWNHREQIAILNKSSVHEETRHSSVSISPVCSNGKHPLHIDLQPLKDMHWNIGGIKIVD